MSIILKGIDLPKDCTECPLEGAEVDDDGFDYWYCKITESMATTIERPSNCPLIQIPKDHGRIIDADLFKEIIKDSVPAWTIGVKIPTYGDMDIMDKIYYMPTILETED